MPDISMCQDKECPKRSKCYRFTAAHSPLWQAYYTQSPRNQETNECDYFMDNFT